MTVTALCQNEDCRYWAETAQEYCGDCLTIWPHLRKPISIPITDEEDE